MSKIWWQQEKFLRSRITSYNVCYTKLLRDYVPSDLGAVTPIYKTFKGWESSKGARSFEALPQEAQEYIRAIEAITQTKVGIISTSPDRNDTIIM